MEAIIVCQEDKISLLTNAEKNYKKSPKDRLTQSYIESRLETLEQLWANFKQDHSNIVSAVKREDKSKLSYFNSDVYSQFEESYTSYKSRLKDDLRKITVLPPVTTSPQVSSCEIKLPRIQLPTFCGNYDEWQTFYDMFVSLIHTNKTLSGVQKLHYLKSGLSGEPENLLRNLSTTDGNYEEAWKQLTRRYNNKRYNSNEIFKRLFNQKNLTTESASAIKQLLDTTSSCLKSLDNLGIETCSWDAIINYLVVSKLDLESRKEWEHQVSQASTDELPTWQQLVEFLESRFRTLELIDNKQHNVQKVHNYYVKPISKNKSFHSTVQEENKSVNNNTCVRCSGQHLLFQCKQFGKQSPEERANFVQTKGLCFNCFAPTHSVKSCQRVVVDVAGDIIAYYIMREEVPKDQIVWTLQILRRVSSKPFNNWVQAQRRKW